MMAAEVERRKLLALNTIKEIFGTESGEESVNLFISHHLEELPQSYWEEHLGSSIPDPKAVLSLIQFLSSWGDDDIEYFDFTLPNEITNYVVSVHFDSSGAIDDISMES